MEKIRLMCWLHTNAQNGLQVSFGGVDHILLGPRPDPVIPRSPDDHLQQQMTLRSPVPRINGAIPQYAQHIARFSRRQKIPKTI